MADAHARPSNRRMRDAAVPPRTLLMQGPAHRVTATSRPGPAGHDHANHASLEKAKDGVRDPVCGMTVDPH